MTKQRHDYFLVTFDRIYYKSPYYLIDGQKIGKINIA